MTKPLKTAGALRASDTERIYRVIQTRPVESLTKALADPEKLKSMGWNVQEIRETIEKASPNRKRSKRKDAIHE